MSRILAKYSVKIENLIYNIPRARNDRFIVRNRRTIVRSELALSSKSILSVQSSSHSRSQKGQSHSSFAKKWLASCLSLLECSPETLFELSDSLEGGFRALKVNNGAKTVSNVGHLSGIVAQVGRNLLSRAEKTDEPDISILAEHGGDLVDTVKLWWHADSDDRGK